MGLDCEADIVGVAFIHGVGKFWGVIGLAPVDVKHGAQEGRGLDRKVGSVTVHYAFLWSCISIGYDLRLPAYQVCNPWDV